MSGAPRHVVREADATDAGAIGRLLDAFNSEFDEPTPLLTDDSRLQPLR